MHDSGKKTSKGKWVMKTILAGIVAFLLLNILCLVYQNFPGRTYMEDGPTDYKWTKDGFYSQATEGFAYGRFDENGYNNAYDPKSKIVNILLMGSSHMQAIHVPQNKNTGYLLNQLSHENGQRLYTYNIGIGAHDFLHCAGNFNDAVNGFSPTDYVILETDQVTFSVKSLESVLNNNEPKEVPAVNNPLVSAISKIPYPQLLWRQLDYITEKEEPPAEERNAEAYGIALQSVLKKMEKTTERKSCELIIFYHPHLQIDQDGGVSALTDEADLKLFKEACEENNISFLDMTPYFIKEYETNQILPYGFKNSPVGVGHMNKNGHRIIAQALFNVINDKEEQLKK